MKKNLIYTLLAATILVVVYSFTVKPNHKPIVKAAVKPAAKETYTCTAAVSSVTGVYTGPYSIQITWTASGSPSYFNYGGNYFCYSGSNPNYGGNTSSYSATITIPFNVNCPNNGAYGGINGRVTPYCADGTAGTDKVYAVY